MEAIGQFGVISGDVASFHKRLQFRYLRIGLLTLVCQHIPWFGALAAEKNDSITAFFLRLMDDVADLHRKRGESLLRCSCELPAAEK